MQNRNDNSKETEPKSRLVDPTKAAFAATVFAASVVLTACSGTPSNQPYCPENPSAEQLQAMSDAKARECLEAADREGRTGTYSTYHGHYIGRGFSYIPGSYPSSTTTGSRFVAPSSGGYSSGSSYKSGGGGFFSGSKSSGGAVS